MTVSETEGTGDEQNDAYSLRSLHVLHKHNKFFSDDETLEAAIVRVVRIMLCDDWHCSLPLDIFCLWKKVLHQLLVTNNFQVYMTLSKSATTSTSAIELIARNAVDSFVGTDKFNECIHGLACNSLHNDMDGFVRILEDTRVATDEGDNFLSGHGVRNLTKSV